MNANPWTRDTRSKAKRNVSAGKREVELCAVGSGVRRMHKHATCL